MLVRERNEDGEEAMSATDIDSIAANLTGAIHLAYFAFQEARSVRGLAARRLVIALDLERHLI